MDGRERERCILYNNSFFRRLLLPREKKKRERREREREREREKEEKRKEKQESEKRLVRMRTAKHFLRASAWLHRERDRTRLTSQQRLFFSFFFLVFFSRLLCVFSTFALCFLFYCRNDVNDDDDTDAENQFHPHFADKNNTVILYWSILRASG